VNKVLFNELENILQKFSEKYNNNEKLQKILRKWSADILIWSKDESIGFLITVNSGKITGIVKVNNPNSGKVKIIGDAVILIDIFKGMKNPSHLYLDGVIEVYGSERDQIILDVIVEELWGK
jgi:ABC-type polysaccharide/polyol phosphate transport system ATPase subunit